MTEFKNIFYPSGKPLCYYEDNKQIIFETTGNRLEIFLDAYGRNTGEFCAYNTENNLIKKKQFHPNSDNSGSISSYDWDGELTSLQLFSINRNTHREHIYVQEKGIRRTNSIRKLNPDDNSVSLTFDFFPSGNRKAIIPQNNSLHDGEVIIFYDLPDHPTHQIMRFKDGIKQYSRYHKANGAITNEIVWDDPSEGNFTALQYETLMHEGDREILSAFKQNVLIEKNIYMQGLLQSSLYQDSKNRQMLEAYHYSHHNQQIGKTLYKATEWDENKDIARGTAYNYHYGILYENYDFKRRENSFIKDGLSITETLLNHSQSLELATMRTGMIAMYENGFLIKQEEGLVEVDPISQTLCGNSVLLSRRSINPNR